MNRNIKVLVTRHQGCGRETGGMVHGCCYYLVFDDVVPLRLRGLFADKDNRVSCCLGHSTEWVLDRHVATTVPCTADGYCADTVPATTPGAPSIAQTCDSRSGSGDDPATWSDIPLISLATIMADVATSCDLQTSGNGFLMLEHADHDIEVPKAVTQGA